MFNLKINNCTQPKNKVIINLCYGKEPAGTAHGRPHQWARLGTCPV